MSNDFESWVQQVGQWKDATSHIPSMIREDIVKGRYRPTVPTQGIKSLLEDPLSIQYSMGYKDRRYSLSYDVLKQVVHSLSIISAILTTRCNQVASFSVPFRLSKSLGYVVKHKDPAKLTTKGEREMIKDLERFIYNCGSDKENPHNRDFKRDDFEQFLRKIVRDSLTYDQCAFEIVPDRKGSPFEFVAVDASTIRIAASERPFDLNSHKAGGSLISSVVRTDPGRHPYSTLVLNSDYRSENPAYVQVHQGQIYRAYTRDELAFGVRNPRTDLYAQGYGLAELEQLVTIITAHLYAEEYNRRFFMQGSAPKGILSLKGDAMAGDQLEGFKRQWRANLEGVDNAWRTPVIQTEQGVDWINLNPNNRDMEYNSWLEYLIKVSCAVFLIDPAELNFDLHGGVSQTPLFESSQEWKLKASRDRGLKPLLRFIAKMINDNVIEKIDDNFMFDFVGLDELSEQEKHELRKEQVASYKTLNEIRREEDLPDLEGGDVPMNPTYAQMLTTLQQLKQTDQAQQGAPAGQVAPQGGDNQGGGEDQDKDIPQYEGTFTKSIHSDRPILEVSVGDEYDEWIDLWRS